MADPRSDEELTGKRADRPTVLTGAGLEKGTEIRPGTSTLNGRYVLEESIGEGGMGSVYKARDLVLERTRDRQPFVALKVLRAPLISQFPDAPIALQREAVRTRQLGHHNIVRVFDFDFDGSNYFITMELLQGRTLASKLDERPQGLTLKHALFYLEQICSGLAYAHSQRIVHSDLKPGNIFIAGEDTVKIVDFGIASPLRKLGQKGEETQFDARKMGALSPSYASPQQFERADADPRDDIYSLGCVTFQMLSGRLPFGECISPVAKQKNLAVPPLRMLNKRQNEALRKALSFDRNKRTPTVEQFFDELNDGRAAAGGRAWWIAGVTGVLVLTVAGVAFYQLPRPSEPATRIAPAAVEPEKDPAAIAVTPPVNAVTPVTDEVAQPPAFNCEAFGTVERFEALVERGLDAQTRFSIDASESGRNDALGDIRQIAECLQRLGDQKKISSPASRAWLNDVADAIRPAPASR